MVHIAFTSFQFVSKRKARRAVKQKQFSPKQEQSDFNFASMLKAINRTKVSIPHDIKCEGRTAKTFRIVPLVENYRKISDPQSMKLNFPFRFGMKLEYFIFCFR